MSCREAGRAGVLVPRRFAGQRALNVAVRTLHIGSSGLVLGAATFGADPGLWPLFAGVTGLLLVADEVYRYGEHWFRFAQAWVILGKLALLGWGVIHPEHLAWALWAAVIAGGIISHAPGAVRQRALWGEHGPCALRKRGREASAERSS